MTDIDARIRAALREEDRELLADLPADPSLREMILDSFRGRLRWLVILVLAANLVFLAGVIFAAVRFFQAESVRAMLVWSGTFITGLLVLLWLKIWYWLELNRRSIQREIKRLEVQIAALSRDVECRPPRAP